MTGLSGGSGSPTVLLSLNVGPGRMLRFSSQASPLSRTFRLKSGTGRVGVLTRAGCRSAHGQGRQGGQEEKAVTFEAPGLAWGLRPLALRQSGE